VVAVGFMYGDGTAEGVGSLGLEMTAGGGVGEARPPPPRPSSMKAILGRVGSWRGVSPPPPLPVLAFMVASVARDFAFFLTSSSILLKR
jgi:hypothetical protein